MNVLKSIIDRDNCKILLCNIQSSEPVQYVKVKERKRSKVRMRRMSVICSVQFSPVNSNLFVSASYDRSVTLWKAGSLKKFWTMKKHWHWVSCVRFSPDGTKVASGSSDGFVIISDAHSGKAIDKFDCKSTVNCLDFLSDGGHLVCGLLNRTLQLWNIKTKECVKVFKGHKAPVYSCAVSPDGSIIVSGDGSNVIKLWDRVTGECKQTWKEHNWTVHCLFCSKSGKKILSGSKDNTAILWNVNDGSVIRKFEGHSNWVNSCALSSDETLGFTASFDQTVRIWDMQTGACLQTIRFDRLAYSLTLSPDQSKIIVGLERGVVSFLQRLPGSVIHSISISSVPLSSVLFADQSTIVVTTEEKQTLIIDTVSGKILYQAYTNDTDICLDVDGQALVSKRVALHQYEQRCIMAGFLLMYGAGSKFSNRFKLSIWDVEEVFCDGVMYPDLGIDTNEMYRKIK
jgi:WD40 repeat protein